jgi:methylated-DNA-[protein]-cysteine S-methyltransferase
MIAFSPFSDITIFLFSCPKTASTGAEFHYPASMKTERKSKPAKMNRAREYSLFKSAIGELMLVTDGASLVGIYFAGRDHIPTSSQDWKRNDKHPVLRQAAGELAEYFDGKRKTFSVPLRLSGTEFQESVWKEIARIPYGQTITYTELAKRAGVSDAIRAAGTATGRNPISIIVPCHRVVGKNGTLCGFAGGLDKKTHLLNLERGNGK